MTLAPVGHCAIVMRLGSAVELHDVRRGLAELVARHPLLQTVFDADGLAQRQIATAEAVWPEVECEADGAVLTLQRATLDPAEGRTILSCVEPPAADGTSVLALAGCSRVVDTAALRGLRVELGDLLEGGSVFRTGTPVLQVARGAGEAEVTLRTLLPYERDARVDASRPSQVEAILDVSTFEDVQRVATTCDALASDVLLAAWQAVVARHRGNARIEIARAVEPWTGRERGAYPPLCIVCDVDPRAPVANLVRVAALSRVAADRTLPAAGMVLRFAYLPPLRPSRFEGCDLTVLAEDSNVAPRRLSLSCLQTLAGVRAVLGFDELSMRPADAQLHLDAWVAAVRGVVKDCNGSVGTLPGFVSSPRSAIGAVARPPVQARDPLHDAGRRADALAVQFGDLRMTRGELDRRANSLASALIGAGLRGGDTVAMLLGRSAHVAVATVGVARAGGVLVPIDPVQPPERARGLVADCGATIAVVDRATASVVGSDGPYALCIDDLGVTDRATARCPVAEPAELVYAMYTSGTTGSPRAAQITRSGLAWYTETLRDRLGISEHDRWAHTASLGFSSSMRQLLVPLGAGGAIVIISGETLADPLLLACEVVRAGVTVLDLVPSYWRVLLDALARSECDAQALRGSSLRLMLSASEPLPGALAARMRDAAPSAARIVNMYGLTETTGIVATHEVEAGDLLAPSIPIGWPLAGAVAAVLDDHDMEVAAGIVGHLVVAGPGVGRGYIGDSAGRVETFDSLDGTAVVRTGDLAWRDSDGILYVKARARDRVKVRGVRIDLVEVERCIASHPAVAGAAAAAVEAHSGTRVVVVVTARHGRTLQASELSEHARRRLPAAFVPASFIVTDALPVTLSGKLDRRAVADLAAAPEASQIDGARPGATATEQSLAEIWRAVLGRDRVAPDEDFFDLGGHSLLGIELLGRVEEELGVRLRWSSLLQTSTVVEMAAAIDASLAATGDGA